MIGSRQNFKLVSQSPVTTSDDKQQSDRFFVRERELMLPHGNSLLNKSENMEQINGCFYAKDRRCLFSDHKAAWGLENSD